MAALDNGAPARISVALCTFNGARFLQAQLNSLLGQVRMPDELVVCDDGSADATPQILAAFRAEAPFPVRLFSNPANLGSTANFTQAIEWCEGDVIVLSDQDDVWHADKLVRIETVFSAAPEIGGIFSDGILIDAQGRTLRGGLWRSVGFGPGKQAAVRAGQGLDLLLRANFVTGATLAFRASLKDFLLPVPAGWVHDYWIASLLAAISRLDFIDAALVKYRCHTGQQLGIRRSMAELWCRLAETDNAVYLAAEKRWSEVCERLRCSGDGRDSLAAAKCQAAAAHMHRRGTLSRQRIRRLPAIIKETANGNYFRYSLGISSILRDILLR